MAKDVKTKKLLEKIGECLSREIENLKLMYAVVFDDGSNRVRLESSSSILVVMDEKIVKDIILTVLPLFNLNQEKSKSNVKDAIFLENGGSILITVFNQSPRLPCQVLVSANLYGDD